MNDIGKVKDLDTTNKTGIFFLFNNDITVYVGTYSNIHVRLWQLSNENKMTWDTVRWVEETDYHRAILIEDFYISKLNPKHNKCSTKLAHHEAVNGEGAEYLTKNYPSGWNKN